MVVGVIGSFRSQVKAKTYATKMNENRGWRKNTWYQIMPLMKEEK